MFCGDVSIVLSRIGNLYERFIVRGPKSGTLSRPFNDSIPGPYMNQFISENLGAETVKAVGIVRATTNNYVAREARLNISKTQTVRASLVPSVAQILTNPRTPIANLL